MNKMELVHALEQRICAATGFNLLAEWLPYPNEVGDAATQAEISEVIGHMIARDEMGEIEDLDEETEFVIKFWEPHIRSGDAIEPGQWRYMRSRMWFLTALWYREKHPRFRQQTYRVVEAVGAPAFSEICAFLGFTAHETVEFLLDPRGQLKLPI